MLTINVPRTIRLSYDQAITPIMDRSLTLPKVIHTRKSASQIVSVVMRGEVVSRATIRSEYDALNDLVLSVELNGDQGRVLEAHFAERK